MMGERSVQERPGHKVRPYEPPLAHARGHKLTPQPAHSFARAMWWRSSVRPSASS
jgi:hypothetical protein